MSAHTPAPWWWSRDGKGGAHFGSGDVELGTVAMKPIAYGYKVEGDDVGNARLIVAAPELFDAAREAFRVLEDETQPQATAREMLRAAIAKAMGAT